jgi:hypothetical protein
MPVEHVPVSRPVGQSAAVQAATREHYRQPLQSSRVIPPPIPPYQRELIQNAYDLCDERKYNLAVIVAQMACEVVSELAFSTYFISRGIHELEKPIVALLPNFNLGSGNDKTRKLYEALSGDKITAQLWWSDYKSVVKLRNDIIHKSAQTNSATARAAVKTADQLVRHVDQRLASERASATAAARASAH